MILDIMNVDPTLVVEDTSPPNRRLPQDVRNFGYIPYLADIQLGDLVLFRPRKPRFFQRRIVNTQQKAYGDAAASFTHAAVYVDEYLICEAAHGGVQINSLLDSLGEYQLLVRRPKYEDGEEGFKVAMRSLMRLSQSYNYGFIIRILVQSLSGLHKDRFPKWSDRFGAELGAICSMLYAYSFAEATNRPLVSMKTGIVLPADLADSDSLADVVVRWKRLPGA